MLPYLGQGQISVEVAEHSAYLITELNAFKNVDVKVRVCQSTLMSRFAHSRKIVIFRVLQKIASLMIFRVSCEIASDDFLCDFVASRTPLPHPHLSQRKML